MLWVRSWVRDWCRRLRRGAMSRRRVRRLNRAETGHGPVLRRRHRKHPSPFLPSLQPLRCGHLRHRRLLKPRKCHALRHQCRCNRRPCQRQGMRQRAPPHHHLRQRALRDRNCWAFADAPSVLLPLLLSPRRIFRQRSGHWRGLEELAVVDHARIAGALEFIHEALVE